jgi:hypothetical protein
VEVAGWLSRSIADARDRGLAALVPLLETLAASTAALRAADAEFGHPAESPPGARSAVDHAEDAEIDGRG